MRGRSSVQGTLMLDHLSLRTDSTTTLIATLDIFITATSVNDDDDDHPSGKARAATLHILDTLHGWWVVQGQRERGCGWEWGSGSGILEINEIAF